MEEKNSSTENSIKNSVKKFFRQLGLLLWKNFIVKKRSLVSMIYYEIVKYSNLTLINALP